MRLLAALALVSRAAYRPAPPAVPTVRRALLCASAEAPTINVDGLRKEAQRVLYRAQKKVAKAEQRAASCEERQEALLADESATLEEFEALPNCEELRSAADSEAERMVLLEQLVSGLQSAVAQGSKSPPADDGAAPAALDELVALAKTLGVNDAPPARPPPSAEKPKGPRASTAPRLPYRVFRSADGAEIRVGKQAADNDVLSTDPSHRDGNDWWMHASGCPGSHVVIRANSIQGTGLPKEVELDAAVLAANYSKAAKGGNVGVTLCRARQVSKPAGAKPGLVQLSGDVRTVKLNWKREKARLERLSAAME